MKKILLLFLALGLILTVAGCSNEGPDTRILNADFEVVDNESTISITDKSTSDFDEVDYRWNLKFIDENGKVVHEKEYNGKDLSFYKPNTKKAKLELNLLADGNTSTREKSIPTDFIPLVLDKESNHLTVYFEDGADRWIVKDKNGNKIKEKDLDRKVDHVLFDLNEIDKSEITIEAYDGDWFLNQTDYSTDGNNPPVLDSIGDKTVTKGNNLDFTVTASDPDGDSVELSVTNLPQGANFDEDSGEFTWNTDSNDVGDHDVTFTASDGELVDRKKITITVNEEDQQDVSFSYTKKSETEYEFVASQPTDGKYWEWKLPDEDHWLVYEDENQYTHTFDSSLIGEEVTVKMKIFDENEEEIGYVEKDIYLEDDSDDNSAPTLDSIGDKTVTEGDLLEFSVDGSDPDGDSLTYSASDLPSDASFSNKRFSWDTETEDAGSYDVTFTVDDGELTDSETITITVDEENDDNVSFDYERVSEGKYEFKATKPAEGKYWEWKFPDNDYWAGYEDKNTITHTFDSSLIDEEVTVKLKIFDENEEEIGYHEETFVVH